MKQILFFALCTVLCASNLHAQKDPNQMTDKKMDDMSAGLKKEAMGWTKGGDLGLNLAGSANRNRRLSDGVNQLGFGGIVNLFANNKAAKSFFDNAFMMQLAALRNGGQGKDFLKNGDILRLNSTWGRAISGEKIFAAVDGRIETQMLPTYQGGLLSAPNSTVKRLSQFLAPVSLLLAPGIVYKPNAKWSFFASPAAIDFIYVGNDELARQVGAPLGNEPGKNSRLLLGPALRAKYNNTFLEGRIAFNSSMGWNSSYLDNLNGRILWTNQANIQIYKGLSLKLVGEAFYDHYTQAILSESPTGVPDFGTDTTWRGAFFLAYSRIFGPKK